MSSGVNTAVDFSGRAVLITGGTKGIGAVIAQAFLKAGAEVTVCARNEPAEPPGAGGRSAHFLAADIRDAGQAAAMVERAAERMGRLDVLVNNAGGSPDADAATVSPRFVERIVQLNMLAPFYVAQPANKIMQAQDEGGCIINIGSVSGVDPQPGTAAYSAAKAGLRMFSQALALEWAPKVRVNHITVGLVLTEAATSYYGDGSAFGEIIPMGRMGAPQDVADTCLYLASDLARYVTGADLPVHGGGEYPARWVIARR